MWAFFLVFIFNTIFISKIFDLWQKTWIIVECEFHKRRKKYKEALCLKVQSSLFTFDAHQYTNVMPKFGGGQVLEPLTMSLRFPQWVFDHSAAMVYRCRCLVMLGTVNIKQAANKRYMRDMSRSATFPPPSRHVFFKSLVASIFQNGTYLSHDRWRCWVQCTVL